MADNVAITAGAGTTVATEDVAGVHHQKVKVEFGGDGVATLVETGVGLPVETELTTGDLDSGGGTDTRAVVGLVGSASGGGALIPGDATNGLFVQVKTMPAAARTTDHLGAADMTDVVMNGLTTLTPKYAKANVAASSTDSSIVAAVASKKIRVLAFRLHGGGTATNVTFNSKPAGAGTAISELFALGANGGHSPGYCPVGHFETVSAEGLTVTTGTGSTMGIGVVYIEV